MHETQRPAEDGPWGAKLEGRTTGLTPLSIGSCPIFSRKWLDLFPIFADLFSNYKIRKGRV
jgi:hypothetical protein